jgi:hypothetical protein
MIPAFAGMTMKGMPMQGKPDLASLLAARHAERR